MGKVTPKSQLSATAEFEDFAVLCAPCLCCPHRAMSSSSPFPSRHSCPHAQEPLPEQWRGWIIPSVAGDTDDPAPWVPSVSPSQGEGGLQDVSDWELSWRCVCRRDSAEEQRLEEQHRPSISEVLLEGERAVF